MSTDKIISGVTYRYTVGIAGASVISYDETVSGSNVVIQSSFQGTSPDTNTYNVTSINPNTFNHVGTAATVPLISVTFNSPSYINSIGQGAFAGNSQLTTITIPSSVTNIANIVFFQTTINAYFDASPSTNTSLPNMTASSFSSGGTAYYYPEVKAYDGTTPSNYTTYFQSFGFTNAQEINSTDPITCFKEDTKILTNKGYIPIQNLRKGHLVKTLEHYYLPIVMIGKKEIHHPAKTERIQDQLYKCTQSEYPEIFEDLVLTGCHSILVDEFANEEQKEKTIEVNKIIYVTDRKYRLPACADHRASVYEHPGTHTIYHLALEHNDYYMNYGIYANGLLVETCSKRYLKEVANMTLID
jgi:hypothetical protein